MRFSSVQTVLLLPGLVYCQLPQVFQSQSIDSLLSEASDVVPSLSSYLASFLYAATHTGEAPSTSTISSSSTVKGTTVPTTSIGSSSSVSVMATTSGAITTSSAISKVITMSTATGKVSGSAAPKTENTTSTNTSTSSTSASASAFPTNSKSNAASQSCGFVGGAGILLLVAMLAGL